MARPPRGKRTPLPDGTHAVAAKNPNGNGSVYFEPPVTRSDGRVTNGRWRATWVDQNGKVRRVAAATRAEAEAKRDAKAAAVGKRIRPASRFDAESTVNDLLDWWLTSVAKHRVKTSTYDSYSRFASYLADGIGAQPIIDVGTEMLTRWQADLLDEYAPYTVLNCRKVCRQAFREAVKLELIATNPFDLVDAPRARAASSARALPIDDAKALIVAAGDFRLGAAVTLLFCQGWRVSEVLGLAWEDLDLDAGTAQIRRGWQQAVGPMQFLPCTFSAWAVDEDEDGITNPHDLDDAVATAANYLCGGPDGTVGDERSALLRYNNSEDYVTKVLEYAEAIGSAAVVGNITCPVAGPVSFIDTWLAPRSGGRLHQGVDMFAARGTPVVAPITGELERTTNDLGGLSFRLWGDDGNFYYGAHLSAYGSGVGRVEAGRVVGYVGTSGNAAGTPPHLHFEIHPGRSRSEAARAVNPTPAVAIACAAVRLGLGFEGGE